MRTDFQVGKCYLVKFYDHVVGYEDILPVTLVGFVYEHDDMQVKFTHWKENHEEWTLSIEKTILVKSTIYEVHEINID